MGYGKGYGKGKEAGSDRGRMIDYDDKVNQPPPGNREKPVDVTARVRKLPVPLTAPRTFGTQTNQPGSGRK